MTVLCTASESAATRRALTTLVDGVAQSSNQPKGERGAKALGQTSNFHLRSKVVDGVRGAGPQFEDAQIQKKNLYVLLVKCQ